CELPRAGRCHLGHRCARRLPQLNQLARAHSRLSRGELPSSALRSIHPQDRRLERGGSPTARARRAFRRRFRPPRSGFPSDQHLRPLDLRGDQQSRAKTTASIASTRSTPQQALLNVRDAKGVSVRHREQNLRRHRCQPYFLERLRSVLRLRRCDSRHQSAVWMG
ncbi:1866_t:CDS:2, partial [Scutellospora calospora]